MQPIWEEETSVRAYDVNCVGRLKLASLFNYFQEAAGNHATSLGVGFDMLRARGLFWVLSRAKVRIEQLPVWGDKVILTTWPKGQEGPLFLRDFLLTSREKGTLAAGTSGWVLLDLANYKPHLAQDLPNTFTEFETRHAIQEPLKKLRPPAEFLPIYERKAMLNDLDVNNHVNNARYIEWIMDCYTTADLKTKTLRSIQVNYVGEMAEGDAVRLSRGRDESPSGTQYIEGTKIGSGAKVVQALLEWQ